MLVNGSGQDSIAVNDRGLAYGDGLFETILIHQHQAVLLAEHLDRMLKGALKLRISLDRGLLEEEIDNIKADLPANGVLKVIVTRGAGGRGYRPGDSHETTRILSIHSKPDYPDQPTRGVDAFICKQRLAIQPALAGIKHLNRLEQVLASQEWPEGNFMEGIMLDMNDNVIEGTRSNIFWSEDGQLYTPSLQHCGVEGILRNFLISHFQNVTEINDCSLQRLCAAGEIFLCNSVFGIWPVKTIEDSGVATYSNPDTGKNIFFQRANEMFNNLLNANVDK